MVIFHSYVSLPEGNGGPNLWKPPRKGSCHTMKSPPSGHRLAAPRLWLRDAALAQYAEAILEFFVWPRKPSENQRWYGDGMVNPKIAGKWMFIPLKMVLIGIDPYPYSQKDMVSSI